MKINGVYLSYDIYDAKQMKAVKNGGESIAEAYNTLKDGAAITEPEKERMIAEVYAFFGDVFGDDKAVEVLGESANLTECICACADFMEQANIVKNKIMNAKVTDGKSKVAVRRIK